MKTSGQVALWGWGAWLVLTIIANASAPGSSEEFFNDPEGSTSGLVFFGSLANLGFLVGLVSTAVFAYQSVMDKTVTKHEYNAPVDKSTVHASDNATVATGGSAIDQSGMTIEQNVTINNSGEISNALKDIEEFIKSDSVPDDTQKKFGTLLVDNIRTEAESDSTDRNKISGYIEELKQIIDSSVGAGESIKKAIAVISSLV